MSQVAYKIIVFDIHLRREDDFSPLIGIWFYTGKQNKMFSLLVQDYGITWSERYKCYILPDDSFFDFSVLVDYIHIIELALAKLQEEQGIEKNLLERESKQCYYTRPSLIHYLSYYINVTSDEYSILLDPAAGIGNLTDHVHIPKKIYT